MIHTFPGRNHRGLVCDCSETVEKEGHGWRLGESTIKGAIVFGKHKGNFQGLKRNGGSIDERRFLANIVRWRDDRQMAICCDHSSVCNVQA